MKGKNWREYAPEEKRKNPRQTSAKAADRPRTAAKRRRKRKGGLLRKFGKYIALFVAAYLGFLGYFTLTRPYTVALDAGHGGVDCGAEGVIQEIELTERTTAELETLLEQDGRFRVILSREAGEGKSISERNRKLRRYKPDVMLSIHGNADDKASAHGFEAYPSPPGYENHEESLALAVLLAEEMQSVGATLRGTQGVRFGYYNSSGQKVLVDSSDTEVYDYDTFGMLKHMQHAAVLVEQCFVTNQADVNAFGTEEGCKKAAAAYYRAICRYLEQKEG